MGGARSSVLLVKDSSDAIDRAIDFAHAAWRRTAVQDMATPAARSDTAGRTSPSWVSHSMTLIPVIDRPLRIAFIGAGQMARNHLNAIRRLSMPVAVVGVTDRLPAAADQFAQLAGIRSSFSIEALLSDTKPDVVHVCTPPSSHFEAAHAALDWGAHVYVEKPFALTADDANGLVALARARRRLICAGHQLLREDPLKKLRGGPAGLGDIVQVDSHFAFRPMGPAVPRAG